jgi:hypothetical protein
MNLRSIYEQLGMEAKYEEEIAKLNNRIILIVDNIYARFYGMGKPFFEEVYPRLAAEFAFLTGESKIYSSGVMGIQKLPLRDFFRRDKEGFYTNILNLTLLLEASKTMLSADWNDLYEFILVEAKRAIETTPIDIGYSFSGDRIIKKGAKELDEKLILENLMWLSKYPASKEFFENSLEYYLRKNYPDAITNAYSSLEGLVKTFLNKDKRLDTDDIRKELINKLGLEGDWGQLLHFYCKLAHEFSSRHGKKETGEKLPLAIELVEFYIYITGTFIRLILTLSNKSNSG